MVVVDGGEALSLSLMLSKGDKGHYDGVANDVDAAAAAAAEYIEVVVDTGDDDDGEHQRGQSQFVSSFDNKCKYHSH